MINKIISEHIKIDTLFKGNLKSGDIVSVSVIKQVSDGKWAVSIKGKVFPAMSELSLTPGDRIKAQVTRTGDRLILKVVDDAPRAPIQQVLLKYGIAQDKVSEMIVMSLIKSDLQVTQEQVQRIRKAMDRLQKADAKSARLLALILGKEIDIGNGEGIDELFKLLSYGDSPEDHEKRQKKERDRNADEDAKNQIKKAVEKPNRNPDSMLQIFNHLRGKNQNWIVIPYSYQFENGSYEGTIRVLYNSNTMKTEKIVLVVFTEHGRFSFLIQSKDGIHHIRLFHSDPRILKNISKKMREFNIKLQNKGAKIDDIIYNEVDFDGFSSIQDDLPYKAIDTLT
jgi:hypothetical protein